MSDNTKPTDKPVIEIDIPVEVAESKELFKSSGTNPDLSHTEEVPTISTLLQRKKLTMGKPSTLGPKAPDSTGPALPPRPQTTQSNFKIHSPIQELPSGTPVLEISSAPITSGPPPLPENMGNSALIITPSKRKNTPLSPSEKTVGKSSNRAGAPPAFRKNLKLPTLDLNALQSALKAHRKKKNRIKLDLLGFLSTHFSEVGLFLVHANAATGVLGYGNPSLVSNARKMQILFEQIPSFFEIALNGVPFVGDPDALNPEEIGLFHNLGFQRRGSVGFFPITEKSLLGKKQLVGFLICFGNEPQNFETLTLKKLQALLTNLGPLD